MNAPIKLIGFCGFARSGKDTAAEALTVKHNRMWHRVAFADALKYDAARALQSSQGCAGTPSDKIIGDSFFTVEENKVRFRPFLVEYGRAMRQLDPDYWIKRLLGSIDEVAQDLAGMCNARFVITDVRYANEVDAIHKAGGIVIYITRPGIGPANEEELRSIAEITPDFSIVNVGSIEALHEAVLKIASGQAGDTPEYRGVPSGPPVEWDPKKTGLDHETLLNEHFNRGLAEILAPAAEAFSKQGEQKEETGIET
jgi:hypothetical protein